MAFTILFQGDSITDCGRMTCGGAGYPGEGPGPGYPGLIASRLACDHPEKDYRVINRGISGNRIVDLYARWKIDALNLEPNLLSVLIGVNDTWHEFDCHNGVEVPRYERIFRELMEWTLSARPGIRIVLIEPFIGTAEEVLHMAPEVRQRAGIVRKIAADFKTDFLPAQEILDNACKRAPMNHWLVDGIHPAPAGHQLIADAWLKLTGL